MLEYFGWHYSAVAVPFMETDPQKQKEMYQTFMTDTIASHVVAIEKQLKKNNTGFLVGEQVSFWPILFYILC